MITGCDLMPSSAPAPMPAIVPMIVTLIALMMMCPFVVVVCCSALRVADAYATLRAAVK
jgi:hypothetical protein